MAEAAKQQPIYKKSVLKFKRFSKYVLLDHLFDGGMAEIYRARELTDSSAATVQEKIVAIKLVRQEYSVDPEYVKMFEQELKVCYGLNHPNVSQTFDYGIKNERLYAVLEYVDGRNLKQYLDVMAMQKKKWPIPMAVYITSQICLGLDYSHKFTDKLTGKPLNLIHRDISPHNIMLSFDGLVKVIDFGIAKADTNTEQTKTGVIKGKTSYLAPEYLAEGIKLDHRYDQFAVGLTLWDLLFGKKLFDAKNQMTILKMVYECIIPKPSSLNPEIPEELEEIMLKALSRDPADRYKDCDSMSRVLVKFLYSHYPDFNPSDMVDFIQNIYRTDIQDNKKKMKSYGEIDTAPYKQELREELAGVVFTDNPPAQTAAAPGAAAAPPPVPTPASAATATGAVVGGAAARPAGEATSIARKPKFSTGTTKVRKIKPEMYRMSKARQFYNFMLFLISVPMIALLLAADIASYQKIEAANKFLKEKGWDKFLVVEPPALEGTLVLKNYVEGQRVFIDNKPTAYAAEIKIPLYNTILIRVEQDNKIPHFEEIKLSKTKATSEIEIPELKTAAFGEINTHHNYSIDEVLEIKMDKENRSIQLPLPLIKSYKMPVGNYKGSIINVKNGQEEKVAFSVKENQTETVKPDSFVK